jgi:hypothetical protein
VRYVPPPLATVSPAGDERPAQPSKIHTSASASIEDERASAMLAVDLEVVAVVGSAAAQLWHGTSARRR